LPKPERELERTCERVRERKKPKNLKSKPAGRWDSTSGSYFISSSDWEEFP
jgi:hypothetical protein